MGWEDIRPTNPQGSSRGRVNMSQDLAPLEVYPPQEKNFSGGETAKEAMDPPGSDNPNREGPFRSQSGQLIADRVNELSKADSPQLRELAFSLGNIVHVEPPKYIPHSFRPAHLEIYDIANRWQVLQGCNGWRGKLDPLDPALKAEIIRYGEFAQATYDAFDGNNNSLTRGGSLFDKESLLEEVGLGNRGYEIQNFIYATTKHHIKTYLDSIKRSGSSSSSESNGGDHAPNYATSKESNWIGFVAVCTSRDEILRLGRRDIVIAWRGSCTFSDWIADISDYMSPAGFGPDLDCSHIRVQAGFHKVYMSTNSESERDGTSSARDQVLGAIKAIVEQYRCEGKLSITVTGHSLGGALATLCAYDIAASNYNLMSYSPSAPQRWSPSRTEASSSHEDGHHQCVLPPYFESVESRIHNSLHPRHDQESDPQESEISEEENSVGHPHTGGVRSCFHSKVHHIIEDGHHIVEDVKSLYSNNEAEFPQGKIPITVFTFGGPRVGNVHFRDRMHELGVAVLRIVNVHDLVPKVPGLTQISWAAAHLHKIIPGTPSYRHVGVELVVDNERSGVLKAPATLRQAHALDTYLHLVDVYHSKTQYAGPTGKTFRDYAFVNRTADFLLPKYCIPPGWKGVREVARDSNGNWLFPGRVEGTAPRASNAEDEYAEFWQNVDAAAERSNPHVSQHCF